MWRKKRCGVQGVTRTFAAYSKFSNASSAAHLGFMATCIVELFSLDESASYAHAFTAIKVPPIILDAFRASRTWQRHVKSQHVKSQQRQRSWNHIVLGWHHNRLVSCFATS